MSEGDLSEKRTRSRAGLTPEKVVAEAGALADERGISALSLAPLAERLGVRVPSLYKHVGGLDDLHRRLALAGLRDLAEVLGGATVGRSGLDALPLAVGPPAFRRRELEQHAVQRPTVPELAGDDIQLLR